MHDLTKRIYASAIQRLRQSGVAGVTMRGIAADVGVTAAALYNHYENRDAILSAISAHGYDEIGKKMEAPIAIEEPCERILVLVDRYVSFALDNPEMFDLMFAHQPEKARVFPRDFAKGASRAGNVLLREVERGLRTGALRKAEVWDVARTLWVHVQGFAALRRAGRIPGSSAQVRELARGSATMILRGLAEPGRI